MRIAILSARLPPAADGVGDHAAKLGTALASRGHDVVFISGGDASPLAGCRLKLVGAGWGPVDTMRALSLFVKHRADALVVEYTPFFFDPRSAAPFAMLLAARARRIRSAIVVHEAFYVPSHEDGISTWKSGLLALRDRATLRAADEIIVPSEERALATARALGSSRERIHVVRIGANVEPPLSHRRSVTLPATVVAFGIVAPRRRLEGAIDAVARLAAEGADVRLHIIGRIANREYAAQMALRAESAGIGDRVVFCGELPPAALSAELASAAAGIHTLREGATASSGSLLALLAHGVPTVAVQTPGNHEVFAGALQYADGAAESMAATLRSIIDEPLHAAELGSAALACYREHFAWETVADGLLGALNKERLNARLVTT